MRWNEYFFNLVDATRQKSKDPSSKVGAVIVHPESFAVLSTGWNGFPRGVEDLESRYNDRQTKYQFVVHAEQNAILNAARHGVKLHGAILYVSFHPCHICAASIVQAGIAEVHYLANTELETRWKDSFAIADIIFEEAGVETIRHKPQ
jgi:dCMP deaminase